MARATTTSSRTKPPTKAAKKAAKKAPSKRAASKPVARQPSAKPGPPAKKAAGNAADRLATYRTKRDFAKTPEPSGSEPPKEDGHRFVVQRHRASRLHYDFRLEAAGVLVSWAVPKGPTLDPKARRMAVHMEDHPLGYFDFEGVIPKGEYGGGDVIVWDWGTWSMADDKKEKDPLKAIAKGDLHFDLQGEKLRGRFALVRGSGGSSDTNQWLLLHKGDEFAVPGWDAEDHPKSVKSGRTNDEVLGDPEATWHSNRADGGGTPAAEPRAAKAKPSSTRAKARKTPRPPTLPTWQGPTDDELVALDELKQAGEWTLGEHTLKITNLDKVLFPGRDDGPAVTKRDMIRYFAQISPHLLLYLFDRPVNSFRFPDGIDKPGFWHKALPEHAPAFVTRWRNDEADPGETEVYPVLDKPASLAWAANFASIELNPWTSSLRDVHQPTWALIDVDPGTKSSFDDVLVLARLYRAALDHLGVRAAPKVTGKRGVQIWVPIAAGYSFEDTRRWVETVSRAIGNTVPDLVSWEWEKHKRAGLARLDYTQNAINKTLVAPFSTRPGPGAPVSVPIAWDELDDPDLRPDGWTIRTVLDRLAEHGDPLRELIGLQQELPAL
jgi:bifunctional non-homologous end joining protein LigD